MIEESLRVEHILAASINGGRYSLDHANGPDITAGHRIAVFLGGQWIAGTVQHAVFMYPAPGYQFGAGTNSGYYFRADEGGTVGMCIGMRVRLEP